MNLPPNEQRTGHVFARGSLRKKGAEAAIVGRWRSFQHMTIGAKTVLDGVKLPAGITTNLDTSLTNVYGRVSGGEVRRGIARMLRRRNRADPWVERW
jgi:hypothetical protein